MSSGLMLIDNRWVYNVKVERQKTVWLYGFTQLTMRGPLQWWIIWSLFAFYLLLLDSVPYHIHVKSDFLHNTLWGCLQGTSTSISTPLDHICRMHHVVYGLKQVPLAGFECFYCWGLWNALKTYHCLFIAHNTVYCALMIWSSREMTLTRFNLWRIIFGDNNSRWRMLVSITSLGLRFCKIHKISFYRQKYIVDITLISPMRKVWTFLYNKIWSCDRPIVSLMLILLTKNT